MSLRAVTRPRKHRALEALPAVSKSVQKRLRAQGARRFNVHVEREVIVYAATPDDAGRKAIAHIMKTTTEPPADRKMRVVAIEELPERDDCGPIIDGAPPRETRG